MTLRMAVEQNSGTENLPDHANVVIRPPFLFCAALIAGSLLTKLAPIGPGLAKGKGYAAIPGGLIALVGLIITGWAVRELVYAGTEVPPTKPSTAIVTTGPYAYTRNPIYIGLIVSYIGIALAVTSIWAIMFLVPALVILQRGVVLREEAYLERKFGDVYLDYKTRVKRWL